MVVGEVMVGGARGGGGGRGSGRCDSVFLTR